MLDSAAFDLTAKPIVTQFPERTALPLLGFRGPSQMHGVLLFIEQHTRLPCFDAGRCERHVGEVA